MEIIPPPQLTRRQLLASGAIITAELALLRASVRQVQQPVRCLSGHDRLDRHLSERLRRSTVMVNVNADMSPFISVGPSFIGTAVCIGKDIFITCRHVTDLAGIDCSNGIIVVGHPDFHQTQVETFVPDRSIDIAILTSKNSPFEINPITSDVPAINEPVTTMTYQANIPLNKSGRNAINPLQGRFIGKWNSTQYNDPDNHQVYVIATDVDNYSPMPRTFGGASGAAYVDSRGRIIGIHRASTHRDTPSPDLIQRVAREFDLDPDTIQSLAFAVPITRPPIRAYLESRGIHYLP